MKTYSDQNQVDEVCKHMSWGVGTAPLMIDMYIALRPNLSEETLFALNELRASIIYANDHLKYPQISEYKSEGKDGDSRE